jgi:CRP/FNR family transcriptional regulator, cyclic AMP receptor protein
MVARRQNLRQARVPSIIQFPQEARVYAKCCTFTCACYVGEFTRIPSNLRSGYRVNSRRIILNLDAEKILRKTPLFASLTDKEMEALAGRVSTRGCERGELLFSEGDACTGLFLIASGKIRIFKLSAGGREQVLAVEGPGSSFAELPVFDGGAYPASASVLEDAELLFISRKDFQGFCLEHPQVALKVIAVVGSRLRRLVGIIEELSFTTVRQRLIALILRLAQEDGAASKSGIAIELTKSHQELASELGTVRELVSRNLGRLQAEGFLQVEGRKIVVKDLQGLRREQTSTD